MRIRSAVSAFNKHGIFLGLYAALLFFCMRPYYSDGCVVLGGEGDFVLYFLNSLKKFVYIWFSDYGVGVLNLSPSGGGANAVMLAVVETFLGSQAANFILVFSFYFLPFTAMFLIAKQVKASPGLSFMVAFLYVFNPFMFMYLQSLNQWNVFSVTAMPLFFWIILRYGGDNFRLFFYFGLASLALSFANTNYPMMAVLQLCILTSLVIISFYRDPSVPLKRVLQKYGILVSAFFLFNAWWLLNLPMILPSARKIYSASVATGWLKTVSHSSGSSMFKIFSLSFGLNDNPAYNFLFHWYSLGVVKMILMIPMMILVYLLFFYPGEIRRARFFKKVFLALLALMLLTRGAAGPLGFIYGLMFRFVPLFYIFKTPVEKFGLLYVFVFSILLLLVLVEMKNTRTFRTLRGLLILFLIGCSAPILAGQFFPDYNAPPYGVVSRKYQDPEAYRRFRDFVNRDPSGYRILSLPGVGNYQICLKNYDGKLYTGLDPLLMNVSRAYISLEHNIPVLYTQIPFDGYPHLLGIFNIRKLVVNEDQVPWYGTVGPDRAEDLNMYFSRSMRSRKFGSLTVFDNKAHFLPRIYLVGGNADASTPPDRATLTNP